MRKLPPIREEETMKRTVIFMAAIIACAAGAAPAQECSPQNWNACQGKPWVIGATVDTPVGEKWWPSKPWGAGEEAGATNWYTKPEIIQRAEDGFARPL
jgi:hypothetical protein